MMQFAALFNEMTPTGAEHFAQFLNTASSSNASQAGRWLSSATTSQVKAAAALLNEGKLDEFREMVGIGKGFWSWLFGGGRKKAVATKRPASAEPKKEDAAPMKSPASGKIKYVSIILGSMLDQDKQQQLVDEFIKPFRSSCDDGTKVGVRFVGDDLTNRELMTRVALITFCSMYGHSLDYRPREVQYHDLPRGSTVRGLAIVIWD